MIQLPNNPWGLSEPELRAAAAYVSCGSVQQVAMELRLDYKAACSRLDRARRKMEVANNPMLIAKWLTWLREVENMSAAHLRMARPCEHCKGLGFQLLAK